MNNSHCRWDHRIRGAFLSILVGIAIGLTGGSPSAWAAHTNTSSVVDAAGQWSGGGAFSNLSSVAQPGGILPATNGALANFPGFLNTFSMKPDLDTDEDGLPDEVDVDNDSDALADGAEVTGTGFLPDNPGVFTDPNLADSDSDGQSDGSESRAGTDPLNGSQALRITEVRRSGNDVVVSWLARSNKQYAVYADPDLARRPMFTNELSTAPASGPAVGPWWVMTNSYTDLGAAASTNRRYYQIRLAP